MLVAGVDEVGRGPLAGPVVAAAVVFKEGYSNSLINDSKKLTPSAREALVPIIESECEGFSIVSVGHRRIDKINIRRASLLAMSLAVRRIKADRVLIDGRDLIDTNLPQEAIIHGDALRVEIGAASILAKVYRDRLMKVLDQRYPGYSLGKHAGYPTKSHREAIIALGPSPVHRRSFNGVVIQHDYSSPPGGPPPADER